MPRNIILKAIPSGIAVQSAMLRRTITSSVSAAAIPKTIVITCPGDYRIRFTLDGPGTQSVVAFVQRNGTQVGPRYIYGGNGQTTFVDDIGGWSKGDLCEISVVNSAAGVGGISGFAVQGSYSNGSGVPIPAGKVTVDTNVTT